MRGTSTSLPASPNPAQQPLVQALQKKSSAPNGCEWNRAPIEFEQPYDTRKFGQSGSLKLGIGRQFFPSQFLRSEELLHV